jgi:hypothetical protein
MPLYKDADYFKCSDHNLFDGQCRPLTNAPCAGIYACEWCKYETVAKVGEELPDTHTCNDHSDKWIPTRESGITHRVKWRLVAAAIQTDAARYPNKV